MHAHKYLININCLFVLNTAFPLVVMTIEAGICMGKKGGEEKPSKMQKQK